MQRSIAMVLTGLGLLLVGPGCASIFTLGKSTYPVTITSTPEGASVSVKNKSGVEVHKALTPTTVQLPQSAGFFQAQNYSLTFEKDGYYPASASLSADLNLWYIGNLCCGGIIGMLIVDPLTGAMWTLPGTVQATLSPSGAAPLPSAPAPESPTVPDSQPAPPKTEPPPAPPTASPLPAAAPAAAQAEPPAQAPDDDIEKKLAKLKELKDAGLLTDEEYEAKRKALVDKL